MFEYNKSLGLFFVVDIPSCLLGIVPFVFAVLISETIYNPVYYKSIVSWWMGDTHKYVNRNTILILLIVVTEKQAKYSKIKWLNFQICTGIAFHVSCTIFPQTIIIWVGMNDLSAHKCSQTNWMRIVITMLAFPIILFSLFEYSIFRQGFQCDIKEVDFGSSIQ